MRNVHERNREKERERRKKRKKDRNKAGEETKGARWKIEKTPEKDNARGVEQKDPDRRITGTREEE